MLYPVRVADKSSRQSADQLVTMANAIISGLTNNPVFPSPAVDGLEAALALQPHGGKAATAEKNNRREALLPMLRKLKHYVEDNCGNDLAVLLSSGFEAVASGRNHLPLATPSILSIDFGESSELVLKVTPIARAKCYDVRSAPVNADNTSGSWQAAGPFTTSRSMTVSGLIPGKIYAFRVRAVGGASRYSDWRNPVSHMCA